MRKEDAKKAAKELVSKMTIEERASQLRYDAPAIKRLGVPAYNWWNEALHGVARAGSATSFPQAIGLAATFDTELLKEIGDVIATEGRAKYYAYSQKEDRDIYKGLTFWSPNVNIFRDPRWGRGHETYGEDPYLTGRLGVAFVKGLQGEGEELKSAACAKHFAVHSGPEAVRHEFDAQVSEKDLWETYLPAFEELAEESGVVGFMGAYNRVNGDPACGNERLIEDILRKEWKFDGYFVSDCWAVRDFHEHHMVTANAEESAAKAVNAGCDLNCGNTYLHILKALQDGLVSEETITRAAERLFTIRYQLGIMNGDEKEEAEKYPYQLVECKEHLELAQKAAHKGITLLKNDGILPLDASKLKTIGVIGPNADSRACLVGNYHGTSSEYITLLDGIRQFVGEDVRILYSEGSQLKKDKTEALAFDDDRLAEAEIVAEQSDVVLLCVGLDETLEGEEGDDGNAYFSGDKEDLLLPPAQRRLMEAVAKTGKPVVLCLVAGSDIDLSYAAENFGAIVDVWYPGARGGKAVADVLFGKVSPSGKLPVTFYQTLSELPAFEDYSMKGRTYCNMENKAQYPFGYGLTYGKVEVTKAEFVSTGDTVTIKAVVENKSDVATEDVVQIYVKQDSVHAARNPKLGSFQRISLNGREVKEVTLTVGKKALTVVNDEGKRIKDAKGYTFYVGMNQPDERSFELTGVRPIELSL